MSVKVESHSGVQVMSGNEACALSAMAAGLTFFAGYPITPSSEIAEELVTLLPKHGGAFIQMEDEIAAMGAVIGAALAGAKAMTATSGTGFSLKQENIGFACMAEVPCVVVNVQRGGPSTRQPTKAEQSDLFTVMFGSHGDAPKVVMAVSSIEDCFYSMITARRIAETFNMVVVVLSDASLATAQQPFPRPRFDADWLAPPIDQNPVPEGARPYDWDPVTGLSRRFAPGQPGGMHTLTGLAHDEASRVAYDPPGTENLSSKQFRPNFQHIIRNYLSIK